MGFNKWLIIEDIKQSIFFAKIFCNKIVQNNVCSQPGSTYSNQQIDSILNFTIFNFNSKVSSLYFEQFKP